MLKSFAGGRVFGGTWGSGLPTVLALHGWRRTHADFAPIFEDRSDVADVADVADAVDDKAGRAGAAGLSAIALDLFGFGATPAPPEAWGTEAYARHLLPLFEEPGILADKIVVVGHSFGGRVALHLAGMVPDRIERMVLCGVPLLDRSDRRARPAIAFRMARRLNRTGLISDERMEAMRNKYGSADYRAASGVMRDVLVRLLAEQYGEVISEVGCPVALVWGENDTEVPVDVAVRAQPLFPQATLRVLPGVGHLVPTEAPSDLRRAILGQRVAPDHAVVLGQSMNGADKRASAPDADPMSGPR